MHSTHDDTAPLDLLVIGGGINGAGIARDAAGRGLRVALCEQNDLASATSQWSSKLIHGGLRYLEGFEFKLVRESLLERELLLKNAPHLVEPRDFVLPHTRAQRPAWILRAGLFLYDFLRGRSVLPKSRAVKLPGSIFGEALRADLPRGFVYPDCCVDDARLVVATMLDAARRGCSVWTRSRCQSARRADGLWQVSIAAPEGDRLVQAKVLVNAGGPWVRQILDGIDEVSARHDVRLVKGSHIVVPSLYEGTHAYTLQNDDGRIVFVIPYRDRYTLIGTTEVAVSGDPSAPECSRDEIDYLCASVNAFLETRVDPARIVWTYAGVRPLVEDGKRSASKVSRDYVFELDRDADAPLLSVFGGKLTTYRKLAERALTELSEWLPAMGRAWTRDAPLAGGEIESRQELEHELRARHPSLPEELLRGLVGRHGSATRELLQGVTARADLGEHFGAALYAREVDWFLDREWAVTAEDVLWRRSKAGLDLDAAQRGRVDEYIAARVATATGS